MHDRLLMWRGTRNQESGLFLRDIGKFDTIPNAWFRASLRYRYLLPAYGMRVGCRCNCKKMVAVDAYGMHFATGCEMEHLRTGTHDGVVVAFNKMLNYLGHYTKREERVCFHGSEKRPDISIFDPVGGTQKLLLDVSVARSLDGAGTGKIEKPIAGHANEPFRNGNARFKKKNDDYKDYY